MAPTTHKCNINTGAESMLFLSSFFFLIIKKNRIGRRKEKGKEKRRKGSKEHIPSHPIPSLKQLFYF
jgi:hypothetical protein